MADQFLQISTTLPSYNMYGLGQHNHRRYRYEDEHKHNFYFLLKSYYKKEPN